jgi:hypothetical protein
VDAEGDEDEEMLDYSAMQTEQSSNRKNKHGAENANVMGESVAPGKRASTPEYNRMPEPRPPTPLNASGRPQRKAAQAAVPKIAKRKKQQREDLESEDEDEYIGVVRRLDDSDDSGEDERDEDVEEEESLESATRQGQPSGVRGRKPLYKQNRIKSKSDLPIYAQHAYSASAMGFPKLPMPMIFLPGLKSRKPPPIPIPELTKKSRGRRVPDAARPMAVRTIGSTSVTLQIAESQSFVSLFPSPVTHTSPDNSLAVSISSVIFAPSTQTRSPSMSVSRLPANLQQNRQYDATYAHSR